MALLTSTALVGLNVLAWAWLRRFAPEAPDRAAVLPVVGTLVLLLALGLSGAGLDLAPVLGAGRFWPVFAVLRGDAAGSVHGASTGCGRAGCRGLCAAFMAAFAAALSLWGVLAALGVTLLPRLAWRRVEDV